MLGVAQTVVGPSGAGVYLDSQVPIIPRVFGGVQAVHQVPQLVAGWFGSATLPSMFPCGTLHVVLP